MTAKITATGIFSRAWCEECAWGLNDTPRMIHIWIDLHNQNFHENDRENA